MRKWAVVLLLLIVLTLFIFVYKKAPLNIILISVDTLRADHLSCYGYNKQTTPNIDKLAQAGILFYNTISQSTVTLSSHSSIFTSRYASQHKALRDARILEDSELTLAEILKSHGYTTAGFVDNGEMCKVFNIGQGFDTYNDVGDGLANINLKVFKWLESNTRKKFFLFIHCYDCHWPYYLLENLPNLYGSDYNNFVAKMPNLLQENKIDDKALLERLIMFYDLSISYTDKKIGKLLRKIECLGLAKKTLIIFTSDHGEEFMEHGHLFHGGTVYDEAIKVPLIFKSERLFMPGKIENQVRSIDIAPTILEILNIPVPKIMMGKSLLGLMQGGQEAERIAFSENGNRELLSCRNLKYKLINDHYGLVENFYDLQNDPQEKNISGDFKTENFSVFMGFLKQEVIWEAVTKYSAQLDKRHKKISELDKIGVLKDKLRSLGYLQ